MNTSDTIFHIIIHLTNTNPVLLFLFDILPEKLLWLNNLKDNSFLISGNYFANGVKQEIVFLTNCMRHSEFLYSLNYTQLRIFLLSKAKHAYKHMYELFTSFKNKKQEFIQLKKYLVDKKLHLN